MVGGERSDITFIHLLCHDRVKLERSHLALNLKDHPFVSLIHAEEEQLLEGVLVDHHRSIQYDNEGGLEYSRQDLKKNGVFILEGRLIICMPISHRGHHCEDIVERVQIQLG